jgi:hypothetical protein
MQWKDFFKFTVMKSGKTFFQDQLATPEDLPMHQLIISRFQHLQLNSIEKKKLSLDLRKIIVCHDQFHSKLFRQMVKDFQSKIEKCPEQELTFSTQAGGIYLFLNLKASKALASKKIVCYTSELPLPLVSFSKLMNIQFIYRPGRQSYLADFSTLWKEPELLTLFELKDFKASA